MGPRAGCMALACRVQTGHGQGRRKSFGVILWCPSWTTVPQPRPSPRGLSQTPAPSDSAPHLCLAQAWLPSGSAQAEVGQWIFPRNHLSLAHRWMNSMARRISGLLTGSPAAAVCFSALGSERQPTKSAHSRGRLWGPAGSQGWPEVVWAAPGLGKLGLTHLPGSVMYLCGMSPRAPARSPRHQSPEARSCSRSTSPR